MGVYSDDDSYEGVSLVLSELDPWFRSGVSDGAGIDFGDDSSEWANDGECDDTRFTGDDEYIGIDFGDSHVRRDASDCRSLFNQGRIRLK